MQDTPLAEMITQARQYRRQLDELEKRRATIQGELHALNERLREAIDVTEDAYANLSEEQFQNMLAELHDPGLLTVEVAYATRERQVVKPIQVCRGATLEDCILVSQVLEEFPEVELATARVGIHGAVKPLKEQVREGDRIEIYRPVEATG
ncbi:MAG: RnfH family protein [Gammaproteobacteria bacterium]|nr:RnfH family protein [Gammaproteobacteria bacterium]